MMRYYRPANFIFAFSAVLFALAFYIRLHEPGKAASLFYFFAQSALIGSAADWFAVTALFSRPLGFPWHTALIPRNRDRIITGIRKLIEEKMIRPDMWEQQMSAFSAVQFAERHFSSPKLKLRIDRWLSHAASAFLASFDTDRAADCAARKLIQSLEKEKMIPLLHQWGKQETAADVIDGTVSFLLKWGAGEAEKPAFRDLIEENLKKYAEEKKKDFFSAMAIAMAEKTGMIRYDEMASAIQEELAANLKEWQDESHPIRVWLRNSAASEWEKIAVDEHVIESAEQWKMSFLHDFPAEELIRRVLSDMKRELGKQEGSSLSQFSEFVINQAWMLIHRIGSDEKLRTETDEKIRRLLVAVAVHEHQLIGEVVEHVLDTYDGNKLNQFIQDKTGRDLCRIRVNGAVVGACIGTVLYSAAVFILFPAIQALK